MKDSSDQLNTDPTDQLKRWFEHFQQLQISNPRTDDQYQPHNMRRINRGDSSSAMLKKIDEAGRSRTSMKSGKVPGIDRISAEMLKANPQLSAYCFGNAVKSGISGHLRCFSTLSMSWS